MIIVIRHGETALNAARVVQPAETPLNERGQRQAERLGLRLADLGVEQVIASDLLRAQMTAEKVVHATGARIEYTPLLQERNFGDIRGKPYADIGRDIFAPDYVPPGGESMSEFDARVEEAWARVVELRSTMLGNLAVVTHGLVCRSLAQHCLALENGQSVPQRWGNTSVTLCEPSAPHSVRLLNCVAHLDGADQDRFAPSGM